MVSSMIFVLGTEATLQERRKLLLTMLDGVYIDSKEEKRILAIKPKPVFKAIFQIADTLEDSGIILLKNEGKGKASETDSCSWWRRGRPRIKQTLPNFSSPCTPKPSRSTRVLCIIDLLIERGSLGLANCDT